MSPHEQAAKEIVTAWGKAEIGPGWELTADQPHLIRFAARIASALAASAAKVDLLLTENIALSAQAASLVDTVEVLRRDAVALTAKLQAIDELAWQIKADHHSGNISGANTRADQIISLASPEARATGEGAE